MHQPSEIASETKESRARQARDRREEIQEKYDFSVIRVLRQQRGLTIEKFAKLCGLSYAPISRIETNLIKPNLDTLDKIAGALGISTYQLVAMAEKRPPELQQGRDLRAGQFVFRVFTFEGIEVGYGSANYGAEADDFEVVPHDFEAVMVREGELEVLVDGQAYTLGAGESIRFDRIFPHHFRALTDVKLVVLGYSN